MKDLKIRVADEAESKEAQELFFELGAKWRSQINREEAAYVINTEYPSIILHGGDMSLNWNTIEQFNSLSYYKEITIQDLRDMVNPMKEYLEPSNNYSLIKAHRKEGNDWIEVPDGADIYVAVFNNNFFYKDNFKYTYRDKWVETAYCGINLEIRQKMPVLWQRHTQPEELPFMDSLNDQYAEIEQVRQSGMKFDSNKPRHSLLPKGAVNSVIEVLEFGAKKYSADNWQEVDNAKERYYNAAMRHIDLWWNGEKLDPETNVHHLAHAATNLFFLMWFDNK